MPPPGRLRVSIDTVRRPAPRALFATLAAVLGLAAILVTQYRVQRLGGAGPGRFRLLWLVLGWQAIALAAATVLRWAPRRAAAALVLASLVALPAMSLTRSSQISDDQYRYAWDGRIQAAGIDPYRYAPDDPALSSFRDNWLWPDAATCRTLHKTVDATDPTHACTHINRPSVRTIYPPVAEGYFLAAHWIPGPSKDHRLQLDAAVLSAALAGVLAFGLRRTGRPPGSSRTTASRRSPVWTSPATRMSTCSEPSSDGGARRCRDAETRWHCARGLHWLGWRLP